jgi:hypothetical protein
MLAPADYRHIPRRLDGITGISADADHQPGPETDDRPSGIVAIAAEVLD